MPFKIDVTIENFQSFNNTCWLNIEIESLIDTANVMISLELPENIEGNSAVWQGPLMKNQSVSTSSRIKFLSEGLFQIGVRVSLTEGAALQSKLALSFVEIKNGILTVMKSKPKKTLKTKIDIRFKEKIEENEMGEKSKRLR